MNRIYQISALCMLLLLSSCLKDDAMKNSFVSYTPTDIGDGWLLSNPESEGIDLVQLKEIYKEFHSDENIWQVRSLLVFKNGKLVAESYTKDTNDRYNPRAIWSCTKQVVGILTGIAIDRQLISDVNEPISKYIPDAKDTDKANITIEHLLTMKSGISYSNDGLSGQTDDILRQLPDKVTNFILSRPLAYQPGEKAVYKDCDPQLVSSVLQGASGKSASEWAVEVLLQPLQIQYFDWMNYKDGTTFGGFGIMTTPREMAKFGQLVLDGGKWNNHQIVSNEWIRDMTKPREEIYSYQFGYLWWSDSERNMVYMSGHGGQFVFVLPDKKMLIVMTSEVNTQGDFQFTRNRAIQWVDKINSISH